MTAERAPEAPFKKGDPIYAVESPDGTRPARIVRLLVTRAGAKMFEARQGANYIATKYRQGKDFPPRTPLDAWERWRERRAKERDAHAERAAELDRWLALPYPGWGDYHGFTAEPEHERRAREARERSDGTVSAEHAAEQGYVEGRASASVDPPVIAEDGHAGWGRPS